MGVRARLVLLGAGLVLFALHAHEYRAWLVDDAGISIAYAEHAASGAGLVSQPGVTPVEGYSNPSWVFLLAVSSRLGILRLPMTPKAIAFAFVALTYAVLLGVIGRTAVRSRMVGAIVFALSSLNPAVVMWAMSGLENSLYGFSIAALASVTVVAIEARWPNPAFALCGAAAALVAVTRPDGVLFVAVPPLVLLAARRRALYPYAYYAAAFGIPFGAFLVSRVAIFHRILPNTAIAKHGPTAEQIVDLLFFTGRGLAKAAVLLEGALPSPFGIVAFVGAGLAVVHVVRAGRMSATLGALLAFTGAAFVDYMLMPEDGTRETRFGTAFIPLYYTSVFVLIDLVLEAERVRRRLLALCALGGATLCLCVPDFARRAVIDVTSPNIDLFFVRRAYAERFDRYAQALHVSSASVLLPDVGGMLLWSHLRVFDLAGLCDESIARLRGRDRARLRDLVFGQMRPTFIHAYGRFSRAVGFEEDARFVSDYEPIHVYSYEEDPDRQLAASGIFVRRDVVGSADARAALDDIRREQHARRPYIILPPPSPIVRWLAMSPAPAEPDAPQAPGTASSLPGSAWSEPQP